MSGISELKIAFIGVSHWHVPLYLTAVESAGLNVVAVSDRDALIADKYAAQLGCRAYTDAELLLDAEKPDFVFAFDVHSCMPDTAMMLINREIPFSIEKPLGVCAQDVLSVKNAADSKNVFCAVPLVWRNSQLLNDLRKRITPEEITNLSFTFNAGPPSRYLEMSPWMLKAATAGSGCMTNLGIHFIDLAMLLTGSSTADVLGSVFHYTNGYDVEDYAVALLRMQCGATVSLQTGYAYPMTDESKRDNHWRLTTRTGYYSICDNKVEIRQMGRERKILSYCTDTDPYYEVYTRQTLNAFLEEAPPAAGLGELLNARVVLDKIILEAQKTRKD